MGATHTQAGWCNPNPGQLGNNTSNKKNGYQKRKVRQFLNDAGYTNQQMQLKIIQSFGCSCKIISDEKWNEFKKFVYEQIINNK